MSVIRKILKIVILVSLVMMPNISLAAFFQDGFESGDLTHAENGARWNSAVSVVTAENGVVPANGSYMAKFRFDTTGGQIAPGAELRFLLGSHKTETYIQYKVWIPNNFNPTNSSNNKLIRIWDENANYSASTNKMGAEYRDYDDVGNIFRAYPITTVNSNSNASCADITAGPIRDWGWPEYHAPSTSLGKWQTWEWHFKSDSGIGDGAIQWWVDGQLVLNEVNKPWLGAPCAPGYFLAGYLFGSANSGFTTQTNIYMDDVVFSDTYIGVTSDTIPPAAPTGLSVI